jgi:glutathione peroxidase
MIIRLTRKGEKGVIFENTTQVKPEQPVWTLKVENNKGGSVDLNQFRGKKILVVNTASDCGFAGQYGELQKLHELKKDDLIILAFPSNDFNNQEVGNDQQISGFCQINYGVTFPVMKKSSVVRTNNQNILFKWLTDKNQNGWNDREPVWNFTKFLINEQGVLTHYFGSAVSPLSKEFLEKIR